MHDERDRIETAAAGGTLPNPKAQRYSGRQMVDRVRLFGTRLKAHMVWMKRFLHGAR